MKIFNNMSLIISAIGGFIVFYLGGYDNLLITIVTLTVLDWLTGLTKSLYDKKLSSKIGFKGIAKTIGMFLLIASTVAIQNIIEKNIPQVTVAVPGLGRRARLKVGDIISSTYMEGVYPEFEFLRRTFHAAGGRFLNGKDLQQRKRVVFLGGEIELYLETKTMHEYLWGDIPVVDIALWEGSCVVTGTFRIDDEIFDIEGLGVSEILRII